jgi:predicted ATPase
VSLRTARFDDHWRHVFSRQFPTRFTSIDLKNLFCLADAEIVFKGGITAVVGSNGVGKSTLTAAVAELLASEPTPMDRMYKPRLRGSRIAGVAFTSGTQVQLAVHDDDADGRVRAGTEFDGEFRWLEPSVLAERCIDARLSDANFADLLEPLTPLDVDEDGLKLASYLVGKHYSQIQVFEIADHPKLDRFPYFRVSANGVSYSSEAMGRGELALLLTYWALQDLPKNSILILEEPETHVSPRSQNALMNIVAKYCDEMGIWVIVTTHSPTILGRIGRDNIVLLARDQGSAAVVKDATKLDIATLLGGGVAFKCVLLVEDEAAKLFALTIMRLLDPDLVRQCEVASAGSNSEISAVLKSMPRTGEWLTLVGLYDGDQRDEIKGNDFKWPHCFLPGNVSPEDLLIGMAESQANAALLAAELQKSVDVITMALGHASGVDPHDYFREFSSAANIDVGTARRGFSAVWLRDEGNKEAALKLIRCLRHAIEGGTSQVCGM